MSAMSAVTCGGCHGRSLDDILDLGTSPPANTPSQPMRYPLRVAVCRYCWLVQLRVVVADDTLFDDSYTFYSSTSPSVVQYDEQFARALRSRYPTQSHGLVVEIASNDGSLLRHFSGVSTAVVGVDPAGGPARVARDRGIPTLTQPFGRDTATQILTQHGKANLIIGKNVIAHVSNLDDVLGGVATLLDSDGVAVFEFQYLGDLIAGNQFDQVYHEHRYFFSLSSLTYAALAHGLHVVDVEQTTPQGGSLRVFLRTPWNAPVQRSVDRLMEQEHQLRDIRGYVGLQMRAERIRERLRSLLLAECDAGRTVAGYGAPAKATTLVNFCELDVDTIHHITDTTPAKQGTKLPGTSIPIVSPKQYPVPDTFLLTAWNYLPEIVRREHEFLTRGGKFIIPFPAPMVI